MGPLMKRNAFGKLLATSIIFSNIMYAHAENAINLGSHKLSVKGDVKFNTNVNNNKTDNSQQINQDGRIKLNLKSSQTLMDKISSTSSPSHYSKQVVLLAWITRLFHLVKNQTGS
ncbi:MAG: hypothetical protein CENE_00397 [Candidatus Celerinatantimonas neptuna]|nr:MAG: hypothetical protein CENE_00397 [Candidatus Celerinatantimonas neptuna]